MAYSSPIIDHRWHRFDFPGFGGYTEEECNIWQAIAQYLAGFNPARQPHDPADFPDDNIKEAMEYAHVHHEFPWVDHATAGFWLADEPGLVDIHTLEKWPVEQQAAYWARKGLPDAGVVRNEQVLELAGKIQSIWAKWNQLQGDNRPLVRSTAGPRRDFDINLDGMAHYGMLPDLLQDLRNIGLSAEDLAPLFRSAYDYVQMWDRCQAQARAMK